MLTALFLTHAIWWEIHRSTVGALLSDDDSSTIGSALLN